MAYERKTTTITTDEFYLIEAYRKLDTSEKGRAKGYIQAMRDNPLTSAVRENKRRYPERFFVDATIFGGGENMEGGSY